MTDTILNTRSTQCHATTYNQSTRSTHEPLSTVRSPNSFEGQSQKLHGSLLGRHLRSHREGASFRCVGKLMMMMALFCLSKRTPLLTHFFLAHNSHKATNQFSNTSIAWSAAPNPLLPSTTSIADGSSPDSATLVAVAVVAVCWGVQHHPNKHVARRSCVFLSWGVHLPSNKHVPTELKMWGRSLITLIELCCIHGRTVPVLLYQY